MSKSTQPLVEIPAEIAHLRTRTSKVNGLTFKVPQGIVRLDIEKGYAGTHGWQVRPPKYSGGASKFFRDVGELRHVGPTESLRMAIDYLAKNPPAPHVRRYPNAKPSNSTGIPGVRLVLMKKKYRNLLEVYIEASNIEKGKSSRRFYCGTENTTTQERVEVAIEKALQFREEARIGLLNHRQKIINSTVRETSQFTPGQQLTSR